MPEVNFRSIVSLAVCLCATSSAFGVFVNAAAVRAENLSNSPAIARETPIAPTDIANNSQAEDAIALSNGEWTIEIGNINSWSGVNGTGNLSYYGCDSAQNCLSLTGGIVTCREGKCWMSWQNGEYFYTLEQFIGEDENTAPPANLIVRKGGTVILRATGFRSF